MFGINSSVSENTFIVLIVLHSRTKTTRHWVKNHLLRASTFFNVISKSSSCVHEYNWISVAQFLFFNGYYVAAAKFAK